jgi:hypothetical protein
VLKHAHPLESIDHFQRAITQERIWKEAAPDGDATPPSAYHSQPVKEV